MTSRVGGLLREHRRAAGLTQEQLAERAKLSVRTIRRLENGQLIDHRVGTVTQLADALALTSDQRRTLLAEFGETSPPPDAANAPVAAASEPADSVPPDVPSRAPDALDEVADQLAVAVRARWRHEEEQSRIHDPVALPVRWQPTPETLTDRMDNIQLVSLGATATPVNLAGELNDIAAAYRRIRSGRLVVLGRAGSGKTILARRFVLDYLRTRASSDPVPVIFSIGSWDPTAMTLRDWLVNRLLRDHPDLDTSAPGRSTLAAALIEGDRILPVLDGFDEIATGLHRDALAELNTTSLPLLLTSRRDEYVEAVAATSVLKRAAAVELIDLTPTDLLHYLPRTTGRTATDDSAGGTVWDPVLDQLRDHPDHPASAHLATALSTPLMVSLARIVYSDTLDRDPADLLDTARFPTSDAIEEHLLASFVPAVYRPRPAQRSSGRRNGRPRAWAPDDAERWLGYLARHLEHRDTQDLAWWQLGTAPRRSWRILAVIVACVVATALSDWLVIVPMNVAVSGVGFALRAALWDVVLVCPTAGLGFGLVYGLMIVVGGVVLEPSRVQVRLLGRRTRPERRPLRTYLSRFATGLLGGFVVGLAYGPAHTVERGLLYGFPPHSGGLVIVASLINAVAFGVLFGLAVGLVFGLMAVLETPLDIDSAASPVSLLRTNRTTVIRQALVLVPLAALLITFGGRVVTDLLQPLLGPMLWPLAGALLIGVIGGLSGAFSYAAAFTAWGQWLVLARVWWPLTGRLPWAMLAFLDDAYQRGVLRQAGAVYQFRHAHLQYHLSQTCGAPFPDRAGFSDTVRTARAHR